MLLERFCRDRLVVLSPRASAYEAARAMTDNHIGAVLVKDDGKLVGIVTDRDLALRVVAPNFPPGRMPLEHVMTRDPATVEQTDTTEKAAALMHALHVRRLVVVDDAQPKGIVTLDDLLLSGAVPQKQLRGIVFAQLTDASKAKPEGFTRPHAFHTKISAPEVRRSQHQAQTMRAFAKRLKKLTGLSSATRAVAAFEVVVAGLLKRLQPDAARNLLAQLPATLRAGLGGQVRGPDRRVTRETIEADLARRLGVPKARAAEVLARITHHMSSLVSAGGLDHALCQLPGSWKPLFRHAA